MQLWPRRGKSQEALELSEAAHPPWAAAPFAVVFALAAALAVAGVDLPPEQFPLAIPFVVAFALFVVFAKRDRERGLSLFEGPDGRELGYWDGVRAQRVSLDELASVSREQPGEPPSLTLTDLRSATAVVPLGTWTKEARLLEEVEQAREAAGAVGTAGNPVLVHRPAWILPTRVALVTVMVFSVAVLVSATGSEEDRVERVTPERIAANAGATASPFAGSLPCTVYVLPLGRASQDHADEVSRRLAMDLPVQPCSLPSLTLDTRALDVERGQLDASMLTGQVRDLFVAEWGDRPATVVGVTEHDLFSSASPDDRFVFGFLFPETPFHRGFGVISTARMGSGEDLARRLQTMSVRHVGVGYFGLERDSEQQSALYETIRSRADLDRMRPQLGDPPLSELELRHARALLLAGA
jgi:hypothetical protein